MRRAPEMMSRRGALAGLAVALAAAHGHGALARETPGLYRSEEGRRAVMDLYERKLAALDFPHRSRMIATTSGETHVLEVGPEAGPPLLAFHGVNFGAPYMADFARPFAGRYRVIMPDIVGQPGRSSAERPPPADHAYARWASEVMDGLGLARVPVMGVSFGGAVALDLAIYAPGRVSKLVLVVPGGFQVGSGGYLRLLARLFIPWHAYRFVPGTGLLPRVLHPLAWEMDAPWYAYFDAVLRHVRWLNPPPGPFTPEMFARISAPTALYAAQDDIFFPGEALIAEARAVLSALADAQVYDSSHFPTRAMQDAMAPRAMAFLAAG